MAYAKARRGLSPRQAKAIVILSMLAVGIPAGVWVWGAWLPAILAVEASILGLGLGLLIVHLTTGPRLRRALALRGQTPELSVTLVQTAEGLVQDLGDVVMSARWSCVTDLYLTRKHWVFLVQSSAIVLPRRFFATSEVERAFIAEALSHMPEAAKARSPDATRFVGR